MEMGRLSARPRCPGCRAPAAVRNSHKMAAQPGRAPRLKPEEGRGGRERVAERPEECHVEEGRASPPARRPAERAEAEGRGGGEGTERAEHSRDRRETEKSRKEPREDLGHGSHAERIRDPPKGPRVVVGVGLGKARRAGDSRSASGWRNPPHPGGW